jgi:ribosomal protein S18 acetylase RimI-like enzyme
VDTGLDLVTAWVANGARDEQVIGHCALVKVDPNRATAAAWSLASRTPATRLVRVAKLFIASDSRGKGVGRVLLDTAVAGAAGIGQRAVLEVSSADQRAVSLYRRAGWIEAETGPRRDWLPQGATSLLFVAPADSGAPTAGSG